MKKRAFTLIELLVVIAIIGMLSSIVLVSLSGARKKARDARRQADLRQIASAMELAYDDSSSECGGQDAYPTSRNAPQRICLTNGQYLNPFPTSPPPRSYTWVDNTGNCSPRGTTYSIPAGQWYCVYVQLESENAWFVATQTGTKKVTTNPGTNCNCGIQ